MALNGCGSCCKVSLIIYNIFTSAVGLLLLVLGLWLRFSDNTREIFNTEDVHSFPLEAAVNSAICLGVIMLIVTLFGHYGACAENIAALKLFSAFLLVAAICEISLGVLTLSNSEETVEMLSKTYDELYILYVKNDDSAVALTLTFIHNLLHCCGMTGIPIIEIVQKTCPEPEYFTLPRCPAAIPNAFYSMTPVLILFLCVNGVLLVTAFICSRVLITQLRRSSLQYTILTNSTPVIVQPHLYPQPVSTFYPHQEPVVFTPAPTFSIPVAQT